MIPLWNSAFKCFIDIEKKHCNKKFTVFCIFIANSRKQVQNIAKLVILYSEEVPLKNRINDFCLKATIVIDKYI